MICMKGEPRTYGIGMILMQKRPTIASENLKQIPKMNSIRELSREGDREWES